MAGKEDQRIDNVPLYNEYLADQREDGCNYENVACPTSLEEIPPTQAQVGYLNYANDNWINLDQFNSILDIGPREFYTYWWFKYKYGKTIQGIELNKSNLLLAQKHETGLIDLDAHQMDKYFESGTFELVTAFHSLEHMLDMDLVLRNCYTVLKPDGILFLAVPTPCGNGRKGHWQEIPNPVDIEEPCHQAGFSTLEMIHVRSPLSGYAMRGEEVLGLFRKGA
jgi:SAM-dependent methyltransferase